MTGSRPIRVLYSFPHKLGSGRICYTAWEQVRGAAAAGAEVTVFPGVLHRPVPGPVAIEPTLARGPVRVPYRSVGVRRACALHDAIVARRLPALRDRVDVVHAWPAGALRTLRAAARLGIPTVLERPNAHTRVAYELVRREAERLGVPLRRGEEHAYDARALAREEREFDAAHRLLCPSEFVVRTFEDQGFARDRLLRHLYGYDPARFTPALEPRPAGPLTMLFVGYCAVRKGLHIALEAWLASPASREGRFLIAGDFLPAYRERLTTMIAHPSVEVLGHRDDVPELMRRSDLMVLPSIEEGFGLVCVEAMGSGCVPLVSDACTDVCRDGENALVHRVGDVAALTRQITTLGEDADLLRRLRDGALRTAPTVTWDAAGAALVAAYQQAIDRWPG